MKLPHRQKCIKFHENYKKNPEKSLKYSPFSTCCLSVFQVHSKNLFLSQNTPQTLESVLNNLQITGKKDSVSRNGKYPWNLYFLDDENRKAGLEAAPPSEGRNSRVVSALTGKLELKKTKSVQKVRAFTNRLRGEKTSTSTTMNSSSSTLTNTKSLGIVKTSNTMKVKSPPNLGGNGKKCGVQVHQNQNHNPNPPPPPPGTPRSDQLLAVLEGDVISGSSSDRRCEEESEVEIRQVSIRYFSLFIY